MQEVFISADSKMSALISILGRKLEDFEMLKKLRQNVLQEMNKTVLEDENGLFVGIVNNSKIVEKMSLYELIKHNIRIEKRYKRA